MTINQKDLGRWRWALCPKGPAHPAENECEVIVVLDEHGNVPGGYTEYGDFDEGPAQSFGLVDIMAFHYEVEAGRSLPSVLAALRADPRMKEDPSVIV